MQAAQMRLPTHRASAASQHCCLVGSRRRRWASQSVKAGSLGA